VSCGASGSARTSEEARQEGRREGQEGGGANKQHEGERALETFGVPFTWEAGKDEPQALTRSFLRDAFNDNETYMEHGEKFFATSRTNRRRVPP